MWLIAAEGILIPTMDADGGAFTEPWPFGWTVHTSRDDVITIEYNHPPWPTQPGPPASTKLRGLTLPASQSWQVGWESDEKDARALFSGVIMEHGGAVCYSTWTYYLAGEKPRHYPGLLRSAAEFLRVAS